MSEASNLLIGAHLSAAGGAQNALTGGHAIGANTIQLFTANQKQWKGKPKSEEEIALWQQAKRETGIQTTMSHAGYLLNLGSTKEDVVAKSVVGFQDELERCHLLDVTYLNFHPGAATGDTEENCLDKIIHYLLRLKPHFKKGKTLPLLETTAGQGSCVGYRFEHLKTIIDGVKDHFDIGVCIDTCHSFSAGYDMRTETTFDQTLCEFDRVIGLKYLKAFHLNDSMKPLGSRRDRHAPLGKGEIGMECFECIVTDERTRSLPMYLETPDGPPLWKEEIKHLRNVAKSSIKTS